MARSGHWPDEQHESSTNSSNRSHRSDDSYHSRSTAPTEYSDRARPSAPLEKEEEYTQYIHGSRSSTQSVETYASTVHQDVIEEDSEGTHVPQHADQEIFSKGATPTTPRDFGSLFPRVNTKYSIRHDDSTLDGNMNLRVDTIAATPEGEILNMTLFHLRMHDLKTRDFSLRRYCRESGREVCNYRRKYQQPPAERPILQRSFSSALGAFRQKSDSRPSTATSFKRADSGYASLNTPSLKDEQLQSEVESPSTASRLPTNTVKLEFSNYAHVDVKRRGTKAGKRYGFEYWGVDYIWKRIVKKSRDDRELVSFNLVTSTNDSALAEIVPIRMTPDQRQDEADRGGWVPPSYFRIMDGSLIDAGHGLSDVLIASGLIALVDDSIKRHFHSKQTMQLQIPIPLSRNGSWKFDVDYIGPKRLIDEMFHRRTQGVAQNQAQ